jgi:hypothetical protein
MALIYELQTGFTVELCCLFSLASTELSGPQCSVAGGTDTDTDIEASFELRASQPQPAALPAALSPPPASPTSIHPPNQRQRHRLLPSNDLRWSLAVQARLCMKAPLECWLQGQKPDKALAALVHLQLRWLSGHGGWLAVGLACSLCLRQTEAQLVA